MALSCNPSKPAATRLASRKTDSLQDKRLACDIAAGRGAAAGPRGRRGFGPVHGGDAVPAAGRPQGRAADRRGDMAVRALTVDALHRL